MIACATTRPFDLLSQASQRRGQEAMVESLVWFGVVVLAVGAGAAVVLWLRRRLKATDEPVTALGMTLEDLRRQRDEGSLSIAEYETLKEVVIREMQEGMGR